MTLICGVAAVSEPNVMIQPCPSRHRVRAVLSLLVLIAFPERRYRWGSRACPQCAERVSREALICHYCRSDLPPMRSIKWNRPLIAVVVIILVLGVLSSNGYLGDQQRNGQYSVIAVD